MNSVSPLVKWTPIAVLALLVTACDATVVDAITPPAGSTVSTVPAPTLVTTESVPPNAVEMLGAYLDDPSDVPTSVLVAALGPLVEDRAELSVLLHEAAEFEGRAAGRSEIAVPIGFNQNRRVIVRTPRGYDPAEPWPLLVAYHVWGGAADRIIDRIESLLGPAIEGYVVAAPDDYRQTIIDAPPPVTSEHMSVWRGVKELWHIDSDRVYVSGYSLGGETTMTVATLHPGEIAGAVAMAAGYSFPSDVDGLWDVFLTNLRWVPVLHVWGADDNLNIVGLNGRDSTDTLALQNERLETLLAPLGLERYQHVRLDGVGHSDAHPPTPDLVEFLTPRRPPPPDRIDHTFRYIHQATAYWVEGHEWDGEGWFTPWPTAVVESGENDEDALTRTIFGLLGDIHAEIRGQTIELASTHLADLTVWLSDGMIDWSKPVTVEFDGQVVFEGGVDPDIGVALTQAVRTRDFDRLRWAGIRIDTVTGTAHPVGVDDELPPILREITLG